jgi:hypothetical protein
VDIDCTTVQGGGGIAAPGGTVADGKYTLGGAKRSICEKTVAGTTLPVGTYRGALVVKTAGPLVLVHENRQESEGANPIDLGWVWNAANGAFVSRVVCGGAAAATPNGTSLLYSADATAFDFKSGPAEVLHYVAQP